MFKMKDFVKTRNSLKLYVVLKFQYFQKLKISLLKHIIFFRWKFKK